jgi:hypothetical protein
MGDVPTTLIDDRDFIVTMARFADGLVNQASVKKRFNFSDEVWESLGSDDRLVEAIEAEKARRIADGSTARERAQVLYAEVPQTLGEILKNSGSDRNRIESAKELRTISANGPQSAQASERFVIQINLGADSNGKEIVERYSKSIAIDANDTEPDDTTTLVAIAAANKPTDDGNGNNTL